MLRRTVHLTLLVGTPASLSGDARPAYRPGGAVLARGAAAGGWPIDQYPYYAPLGAVIAVTSTVAGSVRESLQGLAAIMAGAALSLAVMPVDLPVVADITVLVALGTAISGWRRFGTKASYVPVTALFVLIIGRSDPVDYAVAYAGLTSLGAVIGIALNIAFPRWPCGGVITRSTATSRPAPCSRWRS